MKKIIPSLLVASCLLFSGNPAYSAADNVVQTFVKYHEAIRVMELCRLGSKDQSVTLLSKATWQKLAKYIDVKVHREVGPGERLDLIEKAKVDMRVLVYFNGCASMKARSYLAIYDKELAKL